MVRSKQILPGLDASGRPLGQEGRQETSACRKLLDLWLRALSGVGLMLRKGSAVRQRAAGDGASGEEPPANGVLLRVGELLRRADRWLLALRRRLGGDALIEVEPTERLDEPAEREAGTNFRSRPARAATESPVGKPVLELVEAICADLGEAAALLGETAMRKIVVAIAGAARALLTGQAAAVLAAWSTMAGDAMTRLAVAVPSAPDSG